MREHSNLLDAHSKMHDDIKLFRESMLRNNEKIESRIQKNKTMAQDEVARLKDELSLRLDEQDKNHHDLADETL